jgi:hypothetical protein
MNVLDEIEKFLLIEAERKSLNRQAAELEKQASKIEAALHAHVLANGGPTRALACERYSLVVIDKPMAVKWKEEFIRIAGQKEAERLIDAAGKRTALEISEPVK